MPSQHSSVVGGSSAARVLNCPASAKLVEMVPKGPSSVYADEGTACHTVVADLIEGVLKPADLRPDMIVHIAGSTSTTITRALLHDCIDPAWEHARALIADSDMPPLVEIAAQFPGIAGSFGTCDLITRNAAANRTTITDWKFGQGVAVSATRPDPEDDDYVVINEQLLYYATAAAHERPDYFPEGVTIVLQIVQPRAREGEPLTEVTVTLDDLDDFARSLAIAVMLTSAAKPPMQIGPWCRFAACKPSCPLHRQPLFALVESKAIAVDDTDDYMAQLLGVLDRADRAEEIIAEARKQATEMLARGVAVPGWKLVPKRANRQWTVDALRLKASLRKFKVKAASLYETKLKSPAQVEKLLPKGVELPSGLAAAPSGGLTLAKDTDKRPEITPPPTGAIKGLAMFEKSK